MIRKTLLVLLLSLPAFGQKTTDAPSFDPFSLKKQYRPFKYDPYDAEYWEEAKKLFEEKKALEVLKKAEDRIVDEKDRPNFQGEARLVWTLALRELGFQYGAIFALSKLAVEKIGTRVGSEALRQLDELIRISYYDDEDLYKIFAPNQFDNLHPDIQGFASYFKSLYLLQKGLNEWFAKEFKKIPENSYWATFWRYKIALRDISLNQTDSGIAELQAIVDAEGVQESLKEKIRLQLARLHFEKGDFDKAFSYYNALKELPIREKGRILLEKAWTKYYLKDFSKALGMIEVLRAPIFDVSVTFERHILEAIIYRQLCHYEAVESVVENFNKRFRKSLLSIRRRGKLHRDKGLTQMALMGPEFQPRANLIDQLRKERSRMKKMNLSGALYNPILDHYEKRDQYLQKVIDREIEDRVVQIAKELIDAEEQIKFLDYTSKLDALRIVRQGEDRLYRSDKVQRLTFDKVFWKVKGEFWTDEIDSYKVLISSRCNQTFKPSEDLKLEDDEDIELDL